MALHLTCDCILDPGIESTRRYPQGCRSSDAMKTQILGDLRQRTKMPTKFFSCLR